MSNHRGSQNLRHERALPLDCIPGAGGRCTAVADQVNTGDAAIPGMVYVGQFGYTADSSAPSRPYGATQRRQEYLVTTGA
jgi:hypothetical protein